MCVFRIVGSCWLVRARSGLGRWRSLEGVGVGRYLTKDGDPAQGVGGPLGVLGGRLVQPESPSPVLATLGELLVTQSVRIVRLLEELLGLQNVRRHYSSSSVGNSICFAFMSIW